MKTLIQTCVTLLFVGAVLCVDAAAIEPQGADREATLEAEVRRLSSQLEAAGQHIQKLEAIEKKSHFLEHRVEQLTKHNQDLKAHCDQFVESVEKKLSESSKEWHADLQKAYEHADAADRAAREARAKLRAYDHLVEETQRRLIRGLQSDSPELRAWLRDNLGRLGWPRQKEFNLKLSTEEEKSKLKSALKEKSLSEFLEAPLAECVDFWRECYDVDIALSADLKKESFDIELTGMTNGMTFAKELKTFLDPVGLTYRIKEGTTIVIHRK
jgi:hypothetical protein